MARSKTIVGIANLSPASQAPVHLEAFSDQGGLAGQTDQTLPARGALWDHVKAVFGMGD